MKKLTLFINTRRKKILRKIIQQKIVEINPKKILDNGCGKDGSFDYGVFEKRITTADILYGIDSENLPYSNNSFDCVIFAGVIQYLNNPDKALKECFRVLKKEGILIITTINKNSIIKKLVGFKDEKRSFVMREFKESLTNNGFDMQYFKSIDFQFIPKKYKMILFCVCKKH